MSNDLDREELPADESDHVDIAGPIRLTIDVDGLTWDEIHHITNVAESFVEVVGGDITILEGPVPQDGIEEQLIDEHKDSDTPAEG